jgi:hypothetical protein
MFERNPAIVPEGMPNGNGKSHARANPNGSVDAEKDDDAQPQRGFKQIMRRARRLSHKKLPAPRIIDNLQAVSAAKSAIMDGDVSKHSNQFAARNSHVWYADTRGFGAQATSIANRLAEAEVSVKQQIRREKRDLQKEPTTLERRGEKEPMPWSAAIHIPVLIGFSVGALYLGWSFIRITVNNSGIFSEDQSWVVCAGGILAVLALELVPVTLHRFDARRHYLLFLLVASILCWSAWASLYPSVWVKMLFTTAKVGDQASVNAPVAVFQIGLQLIGEILSSAACLVAVTVIAERHSGLRRAVNPEYRRQAKVVRSLEIQLERIQVAGAAIQGKIQEFNAISSSLELDSKAAVTECYRRLEIGGRPHEAIPAPNTPSTASVPTSTTGV